MLGALSLLLNGGGVAQLKTITEELNKALEGREGSARSVLEQIRTFITQLDDNKADIVDAIESAQPARGLGARAAGHASTPRSSELPSALRSIDQPARRPGQDAAGPRPPQRRRRPGDQGVQGRHDRHAAASSHPVLTELADSGDDFTKSLHVFLTYPFVDEVVGRDPQVARNLHMGDYTNLSIELDVDLPDARSRRAADRPASRLAAAGRRPAARPEQAVPGRPTPITDVPRRGVRRARRPRQPEAGTARSSRRVVCQPS